MDTQPARRHGYSLSAERLSAATSNRLYEIGSVRCLESVYKHLP